MAPPPSSPSRPSSCPARRLAAGLAPASLVLASLTGCPAAPPPAPPMAPARFVPPLVDAEPGEELRLRRGDEDWIWRVASTSEVEVLVEFRKVRGGEPTEPARSLSMHRNNLGLPEGFMVLEMRRDRIEAAGRSWDCWRVRARAGDSVRSYWISEELPVHGVIRIAVEERGREVPATQADVVPEACLRPR